MGDEASERASERKRDREGERKRKSLSYMYILGLTSVQKKNEINETTNKSIRSTKYYFIYV